MKIPGLNGIGKMEDAIREGTNISGAILDVGGKHIQDIGMQKAQKVLAPLRLKIAGGLQKVAPVGKIIDEIGAALNKSPSTNIVGQSSIKSLSSIRLAAQPKVRIPTDITAENTTQGLYDRMIRRLDPLFQHDWEVFMPTIGGVSLRSEFVEEIPLNMIAIESEGIFRNATKEYYPTFSDVGAITVNFYENREMAVTRYLLAWQGEVQQTNGNYKYPDEYKRNIIIHILDAKRTVLAVCTLVGCWPTRPGQLPLTSTADRTMMSCEFSIDSIVFKFN